jgi:O-antigen/teichoic acid export membrane protein
VRHKLGRATPEVRRRVLVMADQAASSLSNVVVAILVARSVGAVEFGAFGLAMVVYGLALGAVRALMGETFINAHAADEPDVRRTMLGELLGATVVVAVAVSLVVAAAAGVVGGSAGAALLALAVGLPLVLVQDTLRYVFVIDRVAMAVLIDVVWLVVVVAALLLAPADAGAAWFVLAWGVSGGAAAALGCAVSGVRVRAAHPWRWLVRSRRDGGRFLGEFATAQASAQLPMLALGGVSGLATLGAVRASQVFYGPLNTIYSGVYLAVVPEGARIRRDRRRLDRLIRATSAAMATLAAVWMVVGTSLPDSVGRQLFDRTWPGAAEIMVPMGLVMIAGGVMSGGFLGVRSLGNAEASLRARLLGAPGQLVLPLVGAVFGGAVGFALGLAVGRLLAAGIWWSSFRALAQRPAAEPMREHGGDLAPVGLAGGADGG